jgi:hypothetical protein
MSGGFRIRVSRWRRALGGVFMIDRFASRCLGGLGFFGPLGRAKWSHMSRIVEMDEWQIMGSKNG